MGSQSRDDVLAIMKTGSNMKMMNVDLKRVHRKLCTFGILLLLPNFRSY